MLWLGAPRQTIDIDFSLQTSHPDAVRAVIAEVAAELDLDLEESNPADFMPLPAGADQRRQLIGQYGQLNVYLFDPYSVALMKVDRAFDADMEDVRYLIQSGQVSLKQLEQALEDVARRYDEPRRLRRNFEALKRSL